MKASFETEDLGQCRTRIKFSIPYEEVKGAIDRAFDQIKGSAFIPGFRPGKAPRPMIERKYSKIIREEALSKLMPKSYYNAIKEKELHPVGDPTFEDIKYEADQPLTFTATVEIIPDFTLPDYKSIEIKKVEVKEPEEEEIQKVLNVHREHHAKYEPVEDRGVEEGDYVMINVEHDIDGEKNSRKNQMLEVNKEVIFPEFIKNIVGMKPTDKNGFEVTFPDDYESKEVAGKTAHYDIELLEIKRKVLPELDDDFAKDTGRAETLEALREDITKTLRDENERRAHSEEENQVIDSLIGMSNLEIPPSMMEAQTNNNIRRAVQYSMYSGVPREELERRQDEIRSTASEQSEKQLKQFLLLKKIAEKEKIVVEDVDLNSHIEKTAEARKMDPKELRKKMEKNDEVDTLRSSMLHEKVLSFLYDNAKKN